MKIENKTCYVCGKEPLLKDEIGLTKKVTTEELNAKIEEFKEEGCALFK